MKSKLSAVGFLIDLISDSGYGSEEYNVDNGLMELNFSR